jgi:hypothetical protein
MLTFFNETHPPNQIKTNGIMVQVKFLTTAEIDELRNRYKRKVVNGQTRTSAIQPKERKAFKYGVTTETKYYRA